MHGKFNLRRLNSRADWPPKSAKGAEIDNFRCYFSVVFPVCGEFRVQPVRSGRYPQPVTGVSEGFPAEQAAVIFCWAKARIGGQFADSGDLTVATFLAGIEFKSIDERTHLALNKIVPLGRAI
jgi:hypothetical protein